MKRLVHEGPFCYSSLSAGRPGTPNGYINMVLRRSEDGGKTWGPMQIAWDDADNTCGTRSDRTADYTSHQKPFLAMPSNTILSSSRGLANVCLAVESLQPVCWVICCLRTGMVSVMVDQLY